MKTSSVKKILFLGVVFVCFFVGWRLVWQNSHDLRSLPDHTVVGYQLEGRSLQVEVVNTPESVEQGLSGRDTMSADGMLFVFPNEAVRAFWMKDMRFAIDIIWIRDGKIVGRVESAPPPEPGTPDGQLPRFISPEPVDMVLETVPGKIAPSP
jgi:uncharacterized membrane protein (UPF0127 family)